MEGGSVDRYRLPSERHRLHRFVSSMILILTDRCSSVGLLLTDRCHPAAINQRPQFLWGPGLVWASSKYAHLCCGDPDFLVASSKGWEFSKIRGPNTDSKILGF